MQRYGKSNEFAKFCMVILTNMLHNMKQAGTPAPPDTQHSTLNIIYAMQRILSKAWRLI